MTTTSTFDPIRATVKDVMAALESKTLTSEELVKIYLDRIEQDNINGHAFRAIIETAPLEKLLETARQLDIERQEGKIRGPLHGAPIVIKDAIATKPEMGLENTIGTIALEGSVCPENAPIVDNLLSQGVIILGKTNVTVFGNFYGNDTAIPNGWSPRGGQTTNIFPGVEAGGSSTGSAVGLAAGFSAAAVGCETFGSIIYPCFATGLFGFKPTPGFLPGEGIMGVTSRQDAPGPMGKSSWDIAAMMHSMSSSFANKQNKDFLKAISPENDISKWRVGTLKGFDPLDYEHVETKSQAWNLILEALKPAIITEDIKAKGASQIWEDGSEKYWDKDGKFIFGHWSGPGKITYCVDGYNSMNKYLSKLENTKITSLEALVEWNRENPEKAFPPGVTEASGGQMMLLDAVKSKGIKTDEYNRFITIWEQISQDIQEEMDQDNLDVIVFPSWSYSWAVAPICGFPSATVPFGVNDQGPYGIVVMGRKGLDEKLVGFMNACEKVFPPRSIPPLFIKDSQ